VKAAAAVKKWIMIGGVAGILFYNLVVLMPSKTKLEVGCNILVGARNYFQQFSARL
jgi:hypothetical protein